MGVIPQKLDLMVLEIFSSLNDSVIFKPNSKTGSCPHCGRHQPRPQDAPVPLSCPTSWPWSCLLWLFSSCWGEDTAPQRGWQLEPGHQGWNVWNVAITGLVGETPGEGPAAWTPALVTLCPGGLGKLALFETFGTFGCWCCKSSSSSPQILVIMRELTHFFLSEQM